MTTPPREGTSIRAVRFPSGESECAGDLYLPAGAPPASGFPLAILGHGLGATRDMGLQHYAERFAASGFAALTFDYRAFGESGGAPRQVLSIGRQHEDYRAALTFARSLGEIDGQRIALWGSSFAGGHVLHLASQGIDVAAVIAQCPFTDGLASSRTVGIGTTLKLGAAAAADLAAAAVRRAPVLVATAGKPGSAALMTAPDALPGYEALEALCKPGHVSGVAARFALQIGAYRPGTSLRKITAPTFVLVCSPDTVAPDETTQRHLQKAANPAIESKTYGVGHFDIYLGAPFETAVADMLAFLERTLRT